MKRFLVVAALVALSAAALDQPEEASSQPKQKRGLLAFDHAPALLHSAPLYDKSYSTPIIHSAPVVTRVFEAPPLPIVRSYAAPYIGGPLITKGFGPHIYGRPAPIYTAPIYTKPLLTHAPLYGYAPKLAAPIAYAHGW